MRGWDTLFYLRASRALTETNPWRDLWFRLQVELGPACVSRSVPSLPVASDLHFNHQILRRKTLAAASCAI